MTYDEAEEECFRIWNEHDEIKRDVSEIMGKELGAVFIFTDERVCRSSYGFLNKKIKIERQLVLEIHSAGLHNEKELVRKIEDGVNPSPSRVTKDCGYSIICWE